MRLLLAEDEKMLSSALVTLLEKNNYSIDAVFNGQDALVRLETEVYDGAILDVMMPKLDGITVLKTVREKGNMLPVLILTAKSEVDDIVHGLDSGANDYLSKPFDTKELLARIRAMTKNKSVPAQPELMIGNIHLSRSTLELKSNINSFRLSSKEFQLMELLIRDSNHPMKSQQITERIWEQEANSDKAIVQMYVSFLNKKLIALRANVRIAVTPNEAYILEYIEI